jgi:uncharacterized damage-inducible protein DinB
MSLNEDLLSAFDVEMAHTRTILQRVPEDRMTWRPHAKSWTLGTLATHIVWLPTWGPTTLHSSSRDVSAPEGPREPLHTRKALLDLFDRHIAAARRDLEAASDADLRGLWTLRRGQKVIFTLPRATVLRTYVLNHMIHHRAQLGVYLRMNEVPLPSIYGPSADEGGME